MVTTSKKLNIELKNIIASNEKVKKVALAEIEKIDAKYKALAEKEKATLTRVIKSLDNQLTFYRDLLAVDKEEESSDTDTPDDSSVEQSQPEQKEEESAIVDTIFVENNDTIADSDSDAETVAKSTNDDNSSDLEWPSETNEDAAPAEESKSESKEDEWPEFPEEWK